MIKIYIEMPENHLVNNKAVQLGKNDIQIFMGSKDSDSFES